MLASIQRPEFARKIGTSHRVLPLEHTLAKVQSLLGHFGITRLANVTHLDTIGIPVYQCIRPNSRTLSVSQGKGLTPLEAKVAAMMEAIESWHAEEPLLPRCRKSVLSISKSGDVSIDVEGLPKKGSRGVDPEREIEWFQGRDLETGGPIWVPSEIISLDRTRPACEYTGVLQRTSIGLASGNSMLEATLHGLYEIIERDCYANWMEGSLGGFEQSAWYKIDSLPPRVRHLAQRVQNANCHIEIGDLTSELDVPCYQCLITATESDEFGPSYAWGMGCHLDSEVALLRAICEAAQVRLTLIAGSRDDLTEADYDHFFDRTFVAYFRKEFAKVIRIDWRFPHHSVSCAIDAQLAHCLERLRVRGRSRLVLCDLTRGDIGIPVVKLVVPGMRAPQDVESAHSAQASCNTGT